MDPKEVIQGLLATTTLSDEVSKYLEFKLTYCLDGKCEIGLVVSEKHHNPFGTLQGGVISDLVEQAMSYAFYSTLSEKESFVTLTLQVNYFKPVTKNAIKAIAVCTNRGKNISFLECELITSEGTLLAKANMTCKIIQIS